jgi:hypothetical protein
MPNGANLRSVRRLPDEVTADGRRHLRYLRDGRNRQRWALTADVPDLGDATEETHQLEQLVVHLLLRTSQAQRIKYPKGFPGRPQACLGWTLREGLRPLTAALIEAQPARWQSRRRPLSSQGSTPGHGTEPHLSWPAPRSVP